MESLESNGFVNYFGYQRFGPLHDNIPLLAPLIGLYLHLDKPVIYTHFTLTSLIY